MFIGESGRDKHVFHVTSCKDPQSCDCPHFSSVNTIVTYRSSLRQMFSAEFPKCSNPFDSIAVDSLILSLQHKFLDNRIPTKQAKRLSPSVIVDTIKQAEFDAIFERDLTKRWAMLRNVLVCKIMTVFGCRASDVLQLRWNDIDMSGDPVIFSFFNTKTAMSNGPRIETLTKFSDKLNVIPALMEWKPMSHAIFPFCLHKFVGHVNPPHMKSTVINKFVKSIFGLDYSSHSLRVSKACDIASEHNDFTVVASQMGMKSPITAKRYSQQRLMVANDSSKKLTFG